jgi:hypothetical protein
MLILFCMRGCGRHPSARHSLRPLTAEGEIWHNLGHLCLRECEGVAEKKRLWHFRHSGMRRRDKIALLFCAQGAGPNPMAPQQCLAKWVPGSMLRIAME